MNVRGNALKVGDVVEVWWNQNGDIITKLEEYTGPLEHLFSEGAEIATFISGLRMTIDMSDVYSVTGNVFKKNPNVDC